MGVLFGEGDVGEVHDGELAHVVRVGRFERFEGVVEVKPDGVIAGDAGFEVPDRVTDGVHDFAGFVGDDAEAFPAVHTASGVGAELIVELSGAVFEEGLDLCVGEGDLGHCAGGPFSGRGSCGRGGSFP